MPAQVKVYVLTRNGPGERGARIEGLFPTPEAAQEAASIAPLRWSSFHSHDGSKAWTAPRPDGEKAEVRAWSLGCRVTGDSREAAEFDSGILEMAAEIMRDRFWGKKAEGARETLGRMAEDIAEPWIG